ncbi:uncharacterized protein [Channa argus]|uniref:uncharacterized protein n=1 Tax=Channa argus TaxID=215402 RepID=UPI0035220526
MKNRLSWKLSRCLSIRFGIFSAMSVTVAPAKQHVLADFKRTSLTMESPIISMVGPGGRCGGEVRRGGACGFLSGGMVLVAVARLVWRGPGSRPRPRCPREVEPCGISRGRDSQGIAAGEVGLSSSPRTVKRFSIWTGEGGPMAWLTKLAAAGVLLAGIQASCVSGEEQARVGTGRWSSDREAAGWHRDSSGSNRARPRQRVIGVLGH